MQRKFTNNLHPDKTLMFNISGFKLRAVSIESGTCRKTGRPGR